MGRRKPIALALALFAATHSLAVPSVAVAQGSRFGIGFEFGQIVGLTPYRKDLVYYEEVQATGREPELVPYLADERPGLGPSFRLQVLVNSLQFSAFFQLFARNELDLHHVGSPRLARDRLRADGTVDDAGVSYRATEPREVELTGAASLWAAGATAGRRWSWHADAVEIFVPLEAGLALLHVSEPAQPYELALVATTGVGVSYRFAPAVALTTQGRLEAYGSLYYGETSASARRSAATNDWVGSALFSTLIAPSAHVGLLFFVQ